jgi:hypothetical protein
LILRKNAGDQVRWYGASVIVPISYTDSLTLGVLFRQPVAQNRDSQGAALYDMKSPPQYIRSASPATGFFTEETLKPEE